MATQTQTWLLFADAVAALDAEGYRIGRGRTERTLRNMWERRVEMDCTAVFRKRGGRLLISIDALKAWRDGTSVAAEVRHG